MLAATVQAIKKIENSKGELVEDKDIIVIKSYEDETVREDGVKEIKLHQTRVNLTKKINETAKLMKQNNAEDKLAEIEKIFSK